VGAVRKVVVGMTKGGDGAHWKLVRDWEVIKRLNNFAIRLGSPVFDAKSDAADLRDLVSSAEGFVHNQIGDLDLPFRVPTVTPVPPRLTPSDPWNPCRAMVPCR
jgi:hypothetical protein